MGGDGELTVASFHVDDPGLSFDGRTGRLSFAGPIGKADALFGHVHSSYTSAPRQR